MIWVILSIMGFMALVNWIFYLPNRLSPEDQAYWDAVKAEIHPEFITEDDDYEPDIYEEYVFDNETIPEFPK